MNTILKGNKSLLLILFVTASLAASAQQQPMYSQYMYNMLNVNPAYAGNRGNISITTLFRNQWTDMPGAPKTSSVSLDMAVNDNQMGIGLQLFDDRLGIERTAGISASYAFKIPVSQKGSLSLGIQAGALNYRTDFSNISTFQSEDPSFYQPVNSILPSAGAGIFYTEEDFYIGASIPALLKTKVGYNNKADVGTATGADLHFYLTTGCMQPLNDDLKLKPSLMIKGSSGAPFQVDFNANLWYRDQLSIGASFRTGDALIGMLEWQINDQLRFGYAYDKSFNQLGKYNGSTHECMLRIDINGSENQHTRSKYF